MGVEVGASRLRFADLQAVRLFCRYVTRSGLRVAGAVRAGISPPAVSEQDGRQVTAAERLDAVQLGKVVRAHRGQRSMRQAAAEAGVSLSTISRVESGSLPDLASFTALCAWAGVSPSRFFTPIAERQDTPVEVAIAHLNADPRLTPEHAAASPRSSGRCTTRWPRPCSPPRACCLSPAGSLGAAAGGPRAARVDPGRSPPGAGGPSQRAASREPAAGIQGQRRTGVTPAARRAGAQACPGTRRHQARRLHGRGDHQRRRSIDVARLEELERIQAYSFRGHVRGGLPHDHRLQPAAHLRPPGERHRTRAVAPLAQARAVGGTRDQRRAVSYLPPRRRNRRRTSAARCCYPARCSSPPPGKALGPSRSRKNTT